MTLMGNLKVAHVPASQVFLACNNCQHILTVFRTRRSYDLRVPSVSLSIVYTKREESTSG